jgi:EAL domain-containing protein (putative c-di-GMP-specific phosphodiesterase class I)
MRSGAVRPETARVTAMRASVGDLAALHRSVVDGTLELLYQPEVELDSGALVAMEGLLRWHHGDLGVLAPPAFLDLAERSGEIGPIGRWVLQEGAAEARRWAQLPGARRRLWLNVSHAQVVSPSLPRLVEQAVVDNDLPDGALGLEVSESTVLQLGPQAAPLLRALQETGVALAVDDFSTWYATLGVIAELPVDVVKLGQRYVRGLGEDVGGDTALDGVVGSLVAMAHDHGMAVVAEGVETWAEAARLTELGCDRAHGWLFSTPQSAERARALLARGLGWRHGFVPTPIPRPRS